LTVTFKNPNTVKFTPISNVFTNIQNSSGESSKNGNPNASHGQAGYLFIFNLMYYNIYI
jgi:hypothetical protein